MTATQRKANKAMVLALSALAMGNEHEADAAGRSAGALARSAGFTCEDVWNAYPELRDASTHPVWNAVVDGWYDARVV